MSFAACIETGSKYAVNITQTTTTLAYGSPKVKCLRVLVLIAHFTYVQKTVLAIGWLMNNSSKKKLMF